MQMQNRGLRPLVLVVLLLVFATACVAPPKLDTPEKQLGAAYTAVHSAIWNVRDAWEADRISRDEALHMLDRLEVALDTLDMASNTVGASRAELLQTVSGVLLEVEARLAEEDQTP